MKRALGKRPLNSIGPIVEVCSNELADPDFIDNPIDRCYYCKRDLFTEIIKLAKKKGIEHVVDGENADDMLADRPGHKAAIEMNIKSPLAEVGLTKDEIRSLSRQLGLRTAGKQQMACLSSRIPFNEEITVDKLRMVEKAEELIRSLGIKELRVRHHGQVARIEVRPDDMPMILQHRDQIVSELKGLGFIYVALDIQGFRSGSMEEPYKKMR